MCRNMEIMETLDRMNLKRSKTQGRKARKCLHDKDGKITSAWAKAVQQVGINEIGFGRNLGKKR